MQLVKSFPHKVREIEHIWIPVSDGVRLSARIWMPEDAEANPVPAVLEYIPYRHRDLTRRRDATMHPYFAGHGYASVRVDIRGSGESEGILHDEYLLQEQLDGLDILKWLAAQPWCDGNVGIIGISWGGFNGLQIAALQPPELKGVVSLCSTDDRYSDDVHYMGGCLLGDNLSWASTMLAYNTCPPDPAVVGDAWRDMWMERLDQADLWIRKWLEHQRRDEFWEHGSICEDFSSVQVPVLAASGWADGYTNAVFRLLENLEGPRLGLVGPWSHKYPHLGIPGPAIGFLQECLRWWDQWLKGKETGIMDEPMLRVWMQDSVPPSPVYTHRPGRWIGEKSWPSPNVTVEKRGLVPGRIVDIAEPWTEEELTVQSPLTLGQFAGKWCSYSATPDLPHDQREEDGGALTFDSPCLEEPLEVLGRPAVELDLSVNKPVAMIAVRLADIAPDDKATRVTYGVLNLTHRQGSKHPRPLKPGERFRVTVPLNAIAQRFPKGHRLRVAISTSYWPLAWPPPEPVRMTVYAGAGQLLLPVRPASADDEVGPIKMPEPEMAVPTRRTRLTSTEHNWFVHVDLGRDRSTLEVIKDEGSYHLSGANVNITDRNWEWYTVENDDFISARGETRWIRGFSRGDWSTKIETRTVLTCSKSHFHIDADIDAYEGAARIFCRTFSQSVPRDLV